MHSRQTIKSKGFSSVSRRSVLAAAILAGGVSAAHAQLFWDAQSQHGPTGGTGTWNSTNTNWWNGSADIAWNSTDADFAGSAGTVTIGSNLTANSVNFTTGGYALTFSASNTLTTGSITVAPGIFDTIGTNGVTAGVLTAPSGGLTISGGGELILAQPLTSTNAITVNGSTLTVGDRNSAPNASNTAAILNHSPLNLTNASLQFGTQTTMTGATNSPNIGPITVTGTSMIAGWRTASANSMSINLTGSTVTMEPNSTLIGSAAGNTEYTNGATPATPFISTGAINVLGPATFQANSGTTPTGTTSGGTAYGGNPFIVQWRLGNITDNGNPITFLGQGTGSQQSGVIEPFSNTYTGNGTWTIGNSNQTGTNGSDAQAVGVTLFQPTGNANGQMTTGNITVNNFSQLYFDGSNDPTTWGNNTQTITINGTGASATVVSGLSGVSGSVGALVFGNVAGGTNTLNSNVVLGSNAEISVTGTSIADLKGNISGPANAVLTKVGGGSIILDGTNNSNWLGGLTIGNGVVTVNSGSSLGSGPLTLASNTTPSSPSLVLNNSTQTIGNLSGTFAGTSAATNTITINGTALHIVQTGATTYGNGTRAGQVSTITGNGSLSLDAASTGTLTLSSTGNNYSGPTTINGGTLLVTGSLTGGGAVAVNGGTLGGTGSITGAVTLGSGGKIAPGVSANTGGILTLSGGLAISSGSTLQFDLDTPGPNSDQISLGSGNLSLGSGAGGIALNVNNIAGLDAGGTFHLITYGGSGPALGPNNSFAITGVLNGSISIDSIGGGLDAVDLIVPANPPLFWAAGNANWDFTSSNWKQSGNPAVFSNGKNVTFDDTGGTTSTISVNIPAEVDPAQLIFNNASRNYLVGGAGPIGGTTTLLVTGTGKVTLTSANTFTGSVSISGGGTLSVANDSYLGNGASVNLSNNSTLQATATFSTPRTIALGAGGGAIDVTSGSSLTLSSSVTGTGGLTKTDSGMLILSGGTANNNYAGATTINGGTLQIGASGSVPITSDVTVASGATFDLQNHTDQIDALTASAGGFVNVNTGGNLNIAGSLGSNIAGNITGTGGTVTNSGTGTVTLSGSNTFGNLAITAGGTVVVGSANALGAAISLTNANSILRFASNYTGSQTLTSNTTGDTVDLNGHNVTLGTLAGSGIANLINGGAITFAGVGGTATGVVVGDNADATTLAVNAVDTKGVSGIGGGAITVNTASTLLLQSIGGIPLTFGFLNDGAGNFTTPGPTLTTITFNNSTLAASGTAYYVGTTSPVIGTSAAATFAAPTTNDHLIVASAIRNPDNGGQDNSNSLNITGNGIVQIASGAVSATSGTQFDGSWNQNMGAGGILLFNGIKGGTGEVLNAPGYQQTFNVGPGPQININSGTIAFGADAINPTNTTMPATLNSFRSPLIFQSSAAIASSGFEYDNAASVSAGGAVFDTTPVTANIAGDININGNVTATVDTYDPVLGAAGGSRSLNFTTNYLDTIHNPGNFNWQSNSTLATSGGGTTGGAVNFARTGPGIFSVGSGATLNVASGTGVNVGKWLPPGTGSVLTTVPGSLDPFTDNSVSSIANNPDTTHSVNAIVSGSLDYAARTGTTDVNNIPDTGVKVYHLGGLSIQSGGHVTLDNAAANADPNPHADRTLLVTGSLSMSTLLAGSEINPDVFAAPSSLNLNNNDLLVHNGNLTTLSSYIASGLLGSSGIYSSAVQATQGAAIGITSEAGYGAGDASPPTTFDGMNLVSSDVLIKYTYMGDTNLDGVVNSADLSILNNGLAHSLTGWQNGDLNYDGKINADDVGLFMLGAAKQGAPLTSALEPAMLGLLAMPMIAGMRRRRR